jgi:endonuclease/exonuclease/phosphatase family metal-dependent hydrolase
MRTVAVVFGCVMMVMVVPCVVALRVVSYNIRAGVGMDNVLNLTRQAEVIRALAPDVVGLQEVDNRTRRSGLVDQASELARMTGLHPTFAKMRAYDGGAYGVAILTRLEPLERREFHYHNPAKPGPANCEGAPVADDYCQGAVAVRIAGTKDPNGAPLWIANTHIGLYDMQLNEVKQLVTEFVPTLGSGSGSDTVFVTGDFNAVPESAAVKWMVSAGAFSDTWALYGVGDGYTFDAKKPFERIDFVFQRPFDGTKCSEIFVPETLASDHRPVVAVFAEPKAT